MPSSHMRIAVVMVAGFLALIGRVEAQPASITNRVLELDGNGSYVELPPNIFNDLDEATIQAWIELK